MKLIACDFSLVFLQRFWVGVLLSVVSQWALALVEPGSGDMEFIEPATGIENEVRQVRAGLHVKTDVAMTISGMVVEVRLTQSFKNPLDRWVEGRYVFPLPENAAVNGMEMRVADRLIKAAIKEKQEAKKIYQQAKAAGKKTALLEQHRPNLFSQKIANIPPAETVHIALTYRQTVDFSKNQFRLYFPMTLTPRYIPSPSKEAGNNNDNVANKVNNAAAIDIDESGWGWAEPNTRANTGENIGVPDAHLITPPIEEQRKLASSSHRATLSITLDAGLPLARIDSPYHDIHIVREQGVHKVSLAEDSVAMDRDFVLSWSPVVDALPQAAVFNETVGGDDYRMVMLMPPSDSTTPSVAALAKEIIFIIDSSGSMDGVSIEQARAGLLFGLGQLSPRDRFNIIEFNSSYRVLFERPMVADSHHLRRAENFVRRLQSGGGTEMLPALNAAFTQLQGNNIQASSQRIESIVQQIVFITDGSIGNENELLSSIHNRLGDSRLFTVAIGSAPNHFFMRKAASFGRGSFTQIGDLTEVSDKMSELFEKISRPVMHSISVTAANATHPQVDDGTLEIFPKRIPDLYQGEPLMIYIHKDYELDELHIQGQYQQQAWQQTLPIKQGRHHPGIASLWARKKIESLLDQQRQGRDQESIKPKVLEVALKHQLMSPYTSFVAVEQEVSRPQDKNLQKNPVPNVLAKGQILQSVPFPQTATNLWLNLWLGLLSLFAAAWLKFRGRYKTRECKTEGGLCA